MILSFKLTLKIFRLRRRHTKPLGIMERFAVCCWGTEAEDGVLSRRKAAGWQNRVLSKGRAALTIGQKLDLGLTLA